MRTRARPRRQICTEDPGDLKNSQSPQQYSYVSLTLCAEALHFLILRELKPPTEDGGPSAPASPYRPDNSTTGALEWFTPNLTPNNHYPSTNFKVLAPNLSVHSDSAINGQTEAFPAIKHGLVQLVVSSSITSMQGC
jgi:hypothetical protein